MGHRAPAPYTRHTTHGGCVWGRRGGGLTSCASVCPRVRTRTHALFNRAAGNAACVSLSKHA